MQAADGSVRVPGALGAVLREDLVQAFGVVGEVFQPEELAALRSDAGLVTIEVPRRDEEIAIRVEAPGFEPFENLRIASTNLSFRLRLRPIDGGTDGAAVIDAVDAGAVAPQPAPEEDEPAPRRSPRRRRR